jgi:hypothetical protein
MNALGRKKREGDFKKIQCSILNLALKLSKVLVEWNKTTNLYETLFLIPFSSYLLCLLASLAQ